MSRRREILQRASEVFERQGVSRTSFEDIAKAVGIKREAIYYYFKNRREILLEVILPQSKSLLSGLRDILDSDEDSNEKLHAAIRNHLESFNPNYLEMTVALREDHFIGKNDKLDKLRKTWNAYNNCWTRLIREGQRSGAFNAKLNPKMVSFGLLGMCNWLSRWYNPKMTVPIQEIIEIYFHMIAFGIGSESAAGQSTLGDPGPAKGESREKTCPRQKPHPNTSRVLSLWDYRPW